MKAAVVAFAFALAGLAALAPAAAQAPGDTAVLRVDQLLIGQRAVLELEVRTPAGATVEVDPSAPSWNGVEVIAITPGEVTPEGDGLLHSFRILIAPFELGRRSFEPSVAVISTEGASIRTLPALTWEVRPSLPAGAPLELSPLAPPSGVAGAESPLLRPALGLAAIFAVAGVALVALFGSRWLVRRLRGRPSHELEAPAVPASFDAVEPLLDRDPVAAYRSLAVMVRACIAERYSLPATALTTSELRSRMEISGADRFQARLVGGFLEECDSVVYAGYRPAGERRRAHLTMAREIVGVAG